MCLDNDEMIMNYILQCKLEIPDLLEGFKILLTNYNLRQLAS